MPSTCLAVTAGRMPLNTRKAAAAVRPERPSLKNVCQDILQSSFLVRQEGVMVTFGKRKKYIRGESREQGAVYQKAACQETDILIHCPLLSPYSYLKASAGLPRAARSDCDSTDRLATRSVKRPAIRNAQGESRTA